MDDVILTQEMIDETLTSNFDLMNIVSQKKYQLKDSIGNYQEKHKPEIYNY